jgi:dGTP triphosphohydrolase
LNEDLIEAISLGHDVGHTPFGHDGERIISAFLQEQSIGIFEHNVQSFRLFHDLEAYGKGLNLTAQVLDGIICHNGEILQNLGEMQLEDLLIEKFKNMFIDKVERQKFLHQVLQDWFNDKIGMFGNLSVNILK